jgi:4-hydroxybutyryl-CoA dehydratase/vinylacetyl-CoA-Delta-isomerase
MHGAGSPQAQRIQISRQMDLDCKITLAKNLAGVNEEEKPPATGLSPHLGRMFPGESNQE